MERTNFPRKEPEPEVTSYFRLFSHLTKYGTDVSVFISNLIDWYLYFLTRGKLTNGMFFQTHKQQTERTGLSDHKIRKCKQFAAVNRLVWTRLKGSPAKEWYELNLEHIDIQSAIELLKDKTFKISSTRPSKSEGHITILNNNTNITSSLRVDEDSLRVSESKISLNDFERFWSMYPRKTDKGKAYTSWRLLCKCDDRPTWRDVKRAVLKQIKSERWQDEQYIPYPSTWLNDSHWLNDPAMMKTFQKRDEIPPMQSFVDDEDGRRYELQPDGTTYLNSSGTRAEPKAVREAIFTHIQLHKCNRPLKALNH